MHPVYLSARSAWHGGAELRHRRARFKNYTYGRQWDDPVRSPSGAVITEGEYASQSGKTPLTNNVIRQLIKGIVGRFRHNLAEARTARKPSAAAEANQLDELDSRLLEEFLISGCAIQRIVAERRMEGEGVWVDNVSPDLFFVNPYTDPRGTDIELCGMLHDYPLSELLLRFGHADKTRCEHLRAIFDPAAPSPLGLDRAGALTFDRPALAGRCRVVEVWVRESRELLRCHDRREGRLWYAEADADAEAVGAETDVSRVHSLRWHGYWFAPGGELLHECDSPWAHGCHPFVVRHYPLTDGEVHPFVEDVIDQQRYINRLITLIDHILSTSAKGVLLFPEHQKPFDMSWEEVAEQWSRPDGILRYNPTNPYKPEQAYSSGGTAGANELLAMEMRLLDRISGVGDAFQGRTPGSGVTGAALYREQAENTAIALLDIFETFNTFRRQRDLRMAQVAQG